MKSRIPANNKITKGFTLVEVLVSLTLFSVGLLGVALQFSSGIKARIDNEIHSSVMQIAMQAVEPLNNSILDGEAAFQASLININDNGAVFSTNNRDFANLSVSVYSASDSRVPAIDDLLTDNNFENWLAPYTVVLMIEYTSEDGVQLNFPTTHVFLPEPE